MQRTVSRVRERLPDAFLTGALGLAVGGVEAALRASPRAGLGPVELAGFVGLSCVLGAGAGAALGFAFGGRVGAVGRHLGGAALGALFGAVTWRYELVLNESLRDPTVLLGIAGGAVAGAAVGALLSRIPARWLLGVAAVGALATAWRGRAPEGAASARPSVLVVSLDTTRADAVGDKPVWSRLAQEGTTFSQAIAAAPITEPSHLAMFTGQAPFRSGVVSNGTQLGSRPLVWQDLQAAGWLTAGFVSGFPLHSRYGWAEGMSVYDDDFGAWPGAESLTLVKAWNQVALKEHALRERSADRVLARAERWLRAHREESFFAFVHFYDAHGPYTSAANVSLGPPPRDGAPLQLPPYWPAAHRSITSADWLRRAYDAEVHDTDAAVGRLLEALGDRLDRTLVVITADHGESLTEHGYLFDHGDDLYDPSLRVPLLVRWPGVVGAGVTLDCQVGGVDLAPTLRELLGLPAGAEPADGVSRAGALRGGACTDTPVVASTTAGRFVETPPVDHAFRSEGLKVIRHQAGTVELYDLAADPGELSPLAPTEALNDRAAAFGLLLGTGGPAASPDMDAETRKALELLGYVEPEGER